MDPELREIAALLLDSPPVWEQSIEELRREAGPVDSGAAAALHVDASDASAAGRGGHAIPMRVYTPEGAAEGCGTTIFYHGGGFVLGSIGAADMLCRLLASRSRCRIVSAGYRLAPEHRFPAAVEDCYDALAWASGRFPGSRLAVAGDSAGGNLAAVTAQLASARGPGLSLQILFYPVLQLAGLTPSSAINSESPGLRVEDMEWFHSQYLPSPGSALDPMASPLLRSDLSGLPPALIVTAGLDILRDQGDMYAARLRAAGVSAACIRYSGMIHGFLSYTHTMAATSAIASAASLLDSVLNR